PPASTGILFNTHGVGDSSTRLLGTRSAGASPHRFRGTALYDWLRARDSATRVLSVSQKDRGAILPVGRARGDVYWFHRGRFTTSTWYRDTLPAWLESWNARDGAGRLAGRSWTLLRGPGAYTGPDSAPYENGGSDIAFPHRFPLDSLAARLRADTTPFIDSLTLDVALEGVHALGLGRRASPDLLVLSLSGTDKVGHAYGPDSRELQDQVLRLDAYLGRFLDSLATLVPPGRTIFALTSDHGVQPFPQVRGTGGFVWFGPLARQLERELDARFGVPFRFEFDLGLLIADLPALRARGVDTDSLAEALARRVAGEQGVARVFTPKRLAAARAGDEDARLWRRTLPADQPWLLAMTAEPGWIWSSSGRRADHGTTLRPDTHVPVIFMGPGIAPRRVARRVTTEDVGPTLAALAGVRPTEPVTGKVLPEVAGRTTGGR
ncbi:MAG TPA: alkaline phosphatase family protein, partial [Gemmatimonadales bacterium]|nr:alkaline phosphatase family protein [Gemmatimonadales bacterium]